MNNHVGDDEVRKSLEALIVDNPDFERLESLVSEFNTFKVIGVIQQELRHSHFLAYMLDPNENHGLRDTFARKLFQRALSKIDKTSIPISPLDLDIWNLEDSDVLREWQNIDILFVNEANRLVIAIENKIWSGEHSDQLQKYWNTLQQHYGGKRILGLYLTPEGDSPSHPDFFPLDYGQVATLVEDLTEHRRSGMNPDVRTLLLHYSKMLRRHIVSESEIAELCQRIYRKHKQALDLIFEKRQDHLLERGEFLKSLIASTPELVEDHSSKAYIRFTLQKWNSAKLKSGHGWTKSGRILLFEFFNFEDSLSLKLNVGPGPQEIRHKLFECALNGQPPLKTRSKALTSQYNTIYSKNFLLAKNVPALTEEEIQANIRERWEEFLRNDLQPISEQILGISDLLD